MALNAHNRMPFEGKNRKSLHKRELRATHNSDYLEQPRSNMGTLRPGRMAGRFIFEDVCGR
jgi:hypothetical protein